jgi:hypothetical protein
MDLDFPLFNGLLLLGFGSCAALALAAFLLWQRAVSRGRIGALGASLGYALCVAAVPLGVWWSIQAFLEHLPADPPSFWTHLADISVAFILFACLWMSWAVAFVVACLAAWRFTVCAKRLGRQPQA